MEKGNHKVLKIILIVLTILAIIIPVVLAYGKLTEKVDNLESYWRAEGPRHTERVNNLDSRIIELEKIAAGTEVSLIAIQNDVGEIKSDLKEISKRIS